ncbi:GAF domain-containing sensor histidine kinase [Dyadobacter sp. CY356]|uniref:GAF domain-containing sensor histidine kinase n=1 Tax=Dyadobacter sp. CY356 TaxID=2906442 RepID=UPI001F2ECD61|nr:GAF domain-containing sensor histidine kinase [Dyadobacter sp. CY356]MCF0058539.1 GAF domain-containing sensor histidine kinase [Dyadobacter sp. CY356]
MELNAKEELIQSEIPIPQNEMERIISLSELDMDFSDPQIQFKDLVKLAAKVAGTSISMLNMLDSLTQWTISNYGLDIDQMLRQDTVCQYTIMTDEHFEVNDLKSDERFKDKNYVTGEPNVSYYYGIPLQVSKGLNIGVLCMLDQQKRVLDPEKVELLKIIADEIVGRLRTQKVLESLKNRLLESHHTQQKVAHDIRGPLGGIIGLASIIRDQGEDNRMEEVLEFINLIHKSGNSILDLAEEILSAHKPQKKNAGAVSSVNDFNLLIFKDKLEKLYKPQAVNKDIRFKVLTTSDTESVPFSKNKLLQIAGNLISNAMKFTPVGGEVTVKLDLLINDLSTTLVIEVKDSGIGLDQNGIDSILAGTSGTTDGTGGEHGYGFGLALVKHLIESLKGKLSITSGIGEGAVFRVELPQN